jgi:hypothetical protein
MPSSAIVGVGAPMVDALERATNDYHTRVCVMAFGIEKHPMRTDFGMDRGSHFSLLAG